MPPPTGTRRAAVRPPLRRGVLVAALVALMAVVAAACATSPSSALTAARRSAGLQGGVNFHCHWNYAADAERIRALDMIAAAGIRWVRIDVGWVTAEPTPGVLAPWYVELNRKCATWARDRGLEVLFTVRRTPDWSHPGRAGDRVLPDDPAVVQASMARLAGAFAGLVDVWEAGNEPDAEFVPYDPGGYVTRYLAPAYRGLKQGDPAVRVIAGGVTYSDLDWYRAVAAAGGLRVTDAVVVHPYSSPGQVPPTTPYTAGGRPDRYKHYLTYLTEVARWIRTTERPDLPIWATEFGWASTSFQDPARPWWNGVGEADQGRFAGEAVAYIRREVPEVEVAFWYNFRDRTGSTHPHEDSMGLVRRDFSPKPAYVALQGAFAGR